MIGSEDPEYIVSEEEVQNAQIEMFMYANALAAERREMPRDDIVVDAARRRGRRRHAVGDGLQPLLPADRGRRQRDDAQLDLARHPRVLRQPRPVPAARRTTRRSRSRRPRRSCAGRRRSCTSAATSPRTPCSAASSSKEGDKVSIWYVSANRDEDVFDDPFTFDIRRSPERARRLRRRRPAPLPRREPRPHGDLRAARGDGPPHPDASSSPARCSRSAPTSSAASSTCP